MERHFGDLAGPAAALCHDVVQVCGIFAQARARVPHRRHAFDDSIGVNGWPMESHVAGDVIFKFPPIPESRGFNELPYRMLVPADIDNLLAYIQRQGVTA
jgi:hypothetical protein